jgi:oxygen-independent coproporphyrinogen III oxidase
LAGIYVHIPFCRQACHYCNFHFTTSLRNKEKLVAAIVKEIGLQKDYLLQEPIQTIYFGGGTPSLLNIEELKRLIDAMKEYYTIASNVELTMEANPDDIDEEKLISWKKIGINRLSIGIQSFFEDDLQWMNRAHNAKQAIDNLRLATQHFDNITIDLIYGSPGLTHEKWKQNVATALAMGIPHLSCYALTVEEKTPLDKLIRQQKVANVNTDTQSTQFLLLMDWLGEAGYEHYEISNFAKPGWSSKHNSSYWQGKKYLGIGPSAHSFNGAERQWNVANNNLYIQSLEKGIVPFEKEILNTTQQLNEYIMISLRTMEGVNLSYVQEKFGIQPESFISKASKFMAQQLMLEKNGFMQLTKEGKLLADGIAADLFY